MPNQNEDLGRQQGQGQQSDKENQGNPQGGQGQKSNVSGGQDQQSDTDRENTGDSRGTTGQDPNKASQGNKPETQE